MEMTMENLINVLTDYFGTHKQEGSYTYELTRVKEAFSVGTMTMDDFEEWDGENIDDLATYLWDRFADKK